MAEDGVNNVVPYIKCYSDCKGPNGYNDVVVPCINCSDCIKMGQVGIISTLESERWTRPKNAHSSRYFLTFTREGHNGPPYSGVGEGREAEEGLPCVCVSVCECIRVYTCVCLCACELWFLSSG